MADSPHADPLAKQRLRWYQFRLRSLLLLTTLVVLLLGIFVVPQVSSYRRQQQAIKRIEKLGGRYEAKSAPAWLRRLTGEDFWDVTLVDLADCDDPDAYIDQIAALPRLEMLAVGGERFTDRHLERLSELPALRGLVLDWTAVSPEALDALQQRLPELDVYLSGRSLAEALRAPRELHYQFYRVYGAAADLGNDHPEVRKHFGDSGFFSYPRDLVVTANIADGDAPLARLRQLQRLDLLTLTVPGITKTGLANLSRLTSVRRLFIDGTPLADDGLAHVESLPNLSTLSLHNTQVTDEGLSRLSHLAALTDLDLADPQITDAGVARLKSMAQLQGLGLGGTQVSDAGLGHLEALPLQRLFLNKTKVTDGGLASVAKIVSLRVLTLDATAITDRGLAQLKALPNLQYLSLNRTAISDAGVASLKELRGLQVLFVAETSVTDQGLEQIRQALPNCRIESK